MENSTDTSIRYLKGVGEQRARLFARLGIHTLYDLVMHFPRGYEDRTRVVPIEQLGSEAVCIEAQVAAPVRHLFARNSVDLVKTRVVDDSGWVDITFFNAPYVKNRLVEGERYVFFGKLSGDPPQLLNPLFEPVEKRGLVTGRLVAQYPLTAGLSHGQVASAVRQVLDLTRGQYSESLPLQVLNRADLRGLEYCLENIHFPRSSEALADARRRLVFEELFLLSLALRQLKLGSMDQAGVALHTQDLSDFYAGLPFTLTGAQQTAIQDATQDMLSGRCMNRLVQGDVGSGKTLVAAACSLFVLRQGGKVALMAPTEILAEQHHRSLSPLLAPYGQEVLLLTAKAKGKKETLARLARPEPCLVVGTQALLSPQVDIDNLVLCITDEQHRFGVSQRRTLSDKGLHPHRLVMSATPIPRSLALVLYGDLDISVMRERPPGRQKIETYVVDESMRARIERFVRKLVNAGQQVYIVCPLVEENDDRQGLRSVKEYAERLSKTVFPDLRVGLIHGRLKATDKEKVMRAFAGRELDILVATTVIEVGVDVENATLMVVENAERYGLSQLHQLRGRVGRGSLRSYCVLFSDFQGETAQRRLKIMSDTDDGFEIAERDLELRGPGDFFGQRQHGLPPLKMADLSNDMELLYQATAEAGRLLEDDPTLAAHSTLKARVDGMFDAAAQM